jgi:Zn-dependent protease/predicted transcriptional regulator
MISGGSIKLFEVRGTAVRVHLTFFLLLAWVATIYWYKGGAQAALYGLVFIAVLFTCVVLHEFGHIFMARRYGIRTPDVTLLPIGGVASLERMPRKPGQEIMVALAGPAVNLVIAIVLLVLFRGQIDLEKLQEVQYAPVNLVMQVAVANIVLFVFNLIPAFPMDGGRVLRALLALSMDYANATRVAATVGQFIAILFGVLGLMGNPLLILVALFIFMAATGEAGFVETQAVTQDYTARDAMISTYVALSPEDNLDRAVERLLETTQQEFPIVDAAGQLHGVLTRERLVNGLREHGGGAAVQDAMIAAVPQVAPGESLATVFEALRKKETPIVAVVDEAHKLMGYVNSENLAELIMVRTQPPKSAYGA